MCPYLLTFLLKVLSHLLTFKMAAQDEKQSLLQEESGAEMLKGGEAKMDSTQKKDSKLVLYHWTQSFSSQKVGEQDESMTKSGGIGEVVALNGAQSKKYINTVKKKSH